MTKNYIKPEVEILSIYSEGLLASSVFESTGEDVTFEYDSDFDSFFN